MISIVLDVVGAALLVVGLTLMTISLHIVATAREGEGREMPDSVEESPDPAERLR